MGLTLGYKASAEQFGPRALLEFATPPSPSRGLGHSASGPRARIGTSVLTPSFRYDPGIVAQAFATLACLFPGRVILELGTGEVTLGFDHLVFHGPGPDQARFVRDFGAEVLPRLRRAYE